MRPPFGGEHAGREDELAACIAGLLGGAFVLATVVALTVAVLTVTGCSRGPGDDANGGRPPGYPNELAPRTVQVPPPPMLRDPKTAVYSYLVWISYAYRVLDSDVATHAFDPYEEVNVNSYVEYNRQKNQAIEQTVTSLSFRDVSIDGDTATVSAAEEWVYRYIDTRTGRYASGELTAAYDSTYTVVRIPERGGWLVHEVRATPRADVK